MAGAAAPEDALTNMLEGDFDPDQWDKQMAAAFDDKYYSVSVVQMVSRPDMLVYGCSPRIWETLLNELYIDEL